MRIKLVKQESHVHGLHFPSREKGWIAYVFVFFGFRETMKPQEFFQAVRNSVPSLPYPSLLPFLLLLSPSPILIPPLKKKKIEVGGALFQKT